MAKTKQLKKLLTEYTAAQIFPGLDPLTQANLADHFYYRYACDSDEQFLHYVRKNINERVRQYGKLLADEALITTTDPLIIDIKNKTKNMTGSDSLSLTGNGSISKTIEILNDLTKTENSTITGTNQTHGTSEGDSSFSNTDGNTRTNNLASSNTNIGKTRALHSDTPQANVSAATSGDLDDPITWTYATDLQDGYSQDTFSSTDTGTITDSGTASGTGTNSTETTGITNSSQTGAKTITDEGTKTTTETSANTDTKSLTSSNSGQETEQLTGRSGHLVSEILDDWRKYIMKADAFLWLCDELDRCFMSNLLYDYDEE